MPRLTPDVNYDSMFEGILPTPKIRTVSLKLSPLPPPVNNPHIDHVRETIIYEGRDGTQQLKSPGFSISKDPRNLLIEVTVVLIDKIEDSGISSWFKDEDLMKYMRLQLIHCEDATFSEKLTSQTLSPLPSMVNKYKENNGLVQNVVISLESSEDLEGFYDKEAGENVVKEASYKFNFAINTTTPKHLTYFANVYLDTDQLINDYSLDLSDNGLISAVSDTTVESVYKDGKQVSSASMYYTKGSNIFTGQVYEAPGGIVVPSTVINDEQIIIDLNTILSSFSSDARSSTANSYKQQLNKVMNDHSAPKMGQINRLLKSWQSRDGRTKAGRIYKLLKKRYEVYEKKINASTRQLTKKQVTNPTIRDDRTIADLADIEITLEAPVEETLALEDIRSANNNMSAETAAANLENALYFSELSLTRPTDSSVRGLFLVDFEKMVSKNSKYSGLLNNTNAEIRSVLRDRVRLEGVRITRERIDDQNTLSQYDLHMVRDTESINQLIANGVIDEKTKEIKGAALESSTNKKKGELIGSVSQVHLDGITNRNIMAFEIRDANMVGKTTGKYKYRVSLLAVDRIGIYLADKLYELVQAKESMKVYYNLANLQCNYDLKNERFTEFFIASLYEKYNLANPDSLMLENIEELNKLLVSESPMDAPWMRPITKYVEVLNLFGDINDDSGASLAKKMYLKVEPSTATPDSILEVIGQLEELETKASDALGLSQTQLASYNSAGSKITANLAANIQIDYLFNSVLDNTTLSNVGARYLEYASEATQGLPVISKNDYVRRLNQENSRYFKNNPTKTANALNDMGTYKLSYLAPSFMQVGGKKLALLERGESLYDPDQFQEMLFSISLLKTNPAARSLTMPVLNKSATSLDQSTKASSEMSSINTQALTLLANFGIAFASPKPSKSSLTITADPLSEVKSILGENTLLAINNAVMNDINTADDLSMITDLTNVEVSVADATSMASALVGTLTNLGMQNYFGINAQGLQVAEMSAVEKEQVQFSKTLDFFDLTNPKNGIDAEMKTAGGKSSTSKIRKIPNQLKSIFLTKTGQASPNKNWFQMEQDPITSPDTRAIFEILYFNLQQVEVLTGFEVSPEGTLLLRSPQWELLQESHFSNVGKIFCRMSRYRNDLLHVGQTDMIDLPAYNDYFVLNMSDRSTKFISPVTDPGLYTSGGEYELPDGTNYIGDYHIHKDGTVMTGTDHTEASEVLVPIGSTISTKARASRRASSLLQADESGYQRTLLQQMVSTHYEQVAVSSEYCSTAKTITSAGQRTTKKASKRATTSASTRSTKGSKNKRSRSKY